MLRAAKARETEGFAVNEKEAVGAGDEVAGCELQNSPPRFRLAGEEAVQLDAAAARPLEVSWVGVELLGAVVGVWPWGALLRRGPTSPPAAVFELLGGGPARWSAGGERREGRSWP